MKNSLVRILGRRGGGELVTVRSSVRRKTIHISYNRGALNSLSAYIRSAVRINRRDASKGWITHAANAKQRMLIEVGCVVD